MDYSAVHEYDVPVAVIIEKRMDRSNDPNIYPNVTGCKTISREQQGDTVKMIVETCANGQIPPALRKVVKPEMLTWIEDITWDLAARSYTYTIIHKRFKNLFTMTGRFTFEDLGSGRTRRTLAGHIRVNLPLVGKLAEKTIVKTQMENLDTDVGYANKHYK